MDKLISALLVAFAIFLSTTLSIFFGALGGWIVGLFFTDTIFTTLQAFGFTTTSLTMWKLGATLGFFGGFLRPIVNKTKV